MVNEYTMCKHYVRKRNMTRTYARPYSRKPAHPIRGQEGGEGSGGVCAHARTQSPTMRNSPFT